MDREPVPATTLEERYRSLFVVGRGGMGTVEVALERTMAGERAKFERIVALKRLLPGATSDARHTEMFLREARLAALLNHPNVVHAFDFGELRGELFLAMEYVEGEPLHTVIRRVHDREGALAPVLAAFILAEVCDGLHAAHELCDVNGTPLNVVHRDVSPHNVMVSYEGHVKLLDFGVAKIEDDHGVTRTGEVKGKTAYMSPEQAMGDKLDRRSDLYSLGSVLYECIAGEKMWGNGTDIEVIRRLALESPPNLQQASKNAPQALCDLHARLVAKDLGARPPTARAVSEELRAFVAETGTRPDARVLRAVMARLFAGEADARKKQLNDAMATAKVAVKARESEPRPVAAAESKPVPLAADSTSAVIARPRSVRARAWLAVVAVATIGLVAGVVLAARPKDPVISETPPTTSAPAPTMQLAVVTPPTSTSTSTSTPTSTSTSTSTPTSIPSSIPVPAVTLPKPGIKHPPLHTDPVRPPVAASSAPVTPPPPPVVPQIDDVDPNPLAK